MQTETHYTSRIQGSNGVIVVLRKEGNKRIGLIRSQRAGWKVEDEVRKVVSFHATKAEAFAAIAK